MCFTKLLSNMLKNSPFYCRPLCYLTTVFMLSLFVTAINKILFAAICVIFAMFFAFALTKQKHAYKFIALTMTFLFLGGIAGASIGRDHKKAAVFSGTNIQACIRLDECIYTEAYASLYSGTLLSVNGEPFSGAVTVEFQYDADFEPFDIIDINADAIDAHASSTASEKLNAIAKNRVLELTVTEFHSVTADGNLKFERLLNRIRNAINSRFYNALPQDTAAYAIALFLGDTGKLSLAFKTDMSALGVSHILAVSGLHTSIIAVIVLSLCEKLRFRRKTRSALVILIAIIFMFIAGLSASVVRSVIMLIMGIIPSFFGRKGDSLTALFTSAFIIGIFDPKMILSCSFLLSFFASLAIVVCIPALSRETYDDLRATRNGKLKSIFKLIRKFVSAIGVSTVCSLITAPIMALYFGKTSMVSVLANLVAVPLSTVSLVISIPLLLFADIPFICSALAFVFTISYRLLIEFSKLATSFGETMISLNYPFFVPIIILLAVIFLYIRLSGIRKPVAFIAPFLICTMIFAASVQIYGAAVSDRTEAVYITNKSSEGFLITSGSNTMYIDIGNGGKTVPLEGIKLSEERYCTVSLDSFMLTHYHAAHISVIKNLLLRYDIHNFYLPTPENEKDTEILENILAAVSDSKITMYTRGDTVNFEKTTLNTSKYSLLERSAHPVISIEIDLGEKQILWLGSSATESSLAPELERAVSRSDAVICGRHGPVTKEVIKLYSSPPENIPIIVSPYADKWTYGFSGETLVPDTDGLAIAVFK